jgi:hypothetical protein
VTGTLDNAGIADRLLELSALLDLSGAALELLL